MPKLAIENTMGPAAAGLIVPTCASRMANEFTTLSARPSLLGNAPGPSATPRLVDVKGLWR